MPMKATAAAAIESTRVHSVSHMSSRASHRAPKAAAPTTMGEIGQHACRNGFVNKVEISAVYGEYNELGFHLLLLLGSKISGTQGTYEASSFGYGGIGPVSVSPAVRGIQCPVQHHRGFPPGAGRDDPSKHNGD